MLAAWKGKTSRSQRRPPQTESPREKGRASPTVPPTHRRALSRFPRPSTCPGCVSNQRCRRPAHGYHAFKWYNGAGSNKRSRLLRHTARYTAQAPGVYAGAQQRNASTAYQQTPQTWITCAGLAFFALVREPPAPLHQQRSGVGMRDASTGAHSTNARKRHAANHATAKRLFVCRSVHLPTHKSASVRWRERPWHQRTPQTMSARPGQPGRVVVPSRPNRYRNEPLVVERRRFSIQERRIHDWPAHGGMSNGVRSARRSSTSVLQAARTKEHVTAPRLNRQHTEMSRLPV
jgi:hypothetical protein